MNKSIIRFLLPLLFLSLLSPVLNGCEEDGIPLRYSLTELPLTAEHSVSFEERFYPLPSGEFAVVQGTGTVRSIGKSGRYQIPLTFNRIQADGTLKYEHTGAVFTTMLLGFDDGRVFRHVFENGKRLQYIDDALRSTASPFCLASRCTKTVILPSRNIPLSLNTSSSPASAGTTTSNTPHRCMRSTSTTVL